MDNIKEIAEKLINEFDFEKVHNAMRATKWVYIQARQEGNEVFFPTLEEVKHQAKLYVNQCLEKDEYCIWPSLGFKLSKSENNEFLLEFILTSSSLP